MASDDDEVLTYKLDCCRGLRHRTRSRPAQLLTKSDLDYEVNQMYTVQVTATDPYGLVTSGVVSV